MQLEVNKNHKRIEFEKLKKPLERFSIGILGTTMAISLYSGALIPKAYAAESTNDNSISDSVDAEIPLEYQDIIRKSLFINDSIPLTKDFLSKFDFLNIDVLEDTDFGYLKYFPNLTDLSIRDYSGNLVGCDILSSISSLKNINIYGCQENSFLDSESLKFISSLNLSSIAIYGYLMYPDCCDLLNNVDEVILDNGYYDFDFSKLTDIKRLDLSNDDVYNYSVYFSMDDYDTLVSNGVLVELGDGKDSFFDVSSRLDSIVDELGLDSNSTDQEKLDAILLYVLENLEYDSVVSSYTHEGIFEGDTNLVSSFYDGGFLYGALEKDTSICGNYAALVEALFNRVGYHGQSAFVYNDSHAWNVVKIDGDIYLVDATWLDGQQKMVSHQEDVIDDEGRAVSSIVFDNVSAVEFLKNGEGHDLRWYMESMDEDHIESIDLYGIHSNVVVPEYMFSDDYIDEDSEQVPLSVDDEVFDAVDVTDKKVTIKIGGREMVIAAGALVGVMTALGSAICIHSKREREKRRRRKLSSGPYNDLFHSSGDFRR